MHITLAATTPQDAARELRAGSCYGIRSSAMICQEPPRASEPMLLLLLLAWTEDEALLERLRAGDEAAFVELLGRHHSALVRLARVFVGDEATAEEIAQETWLAMISGLATFEGRSSLKTWIFQILTNRARTRARRDARTTPLPSWDGELRDEDDPLAGRFNARGGWATPPGAWSIDPEQDLIYRRLLAIAQETIDALPEAQRAVVVMRDLQGMTPAEVCDALEVSEGNQRVLLHRARTTIRAAIERAMREEAA